MLKFSGTLVWSEVGDVIWVWRCQANIVSSLQSRGRRSSPLLSITAWQRRCIDAIKRLIDAIWIRCHSSSNAIRSWSSVFGCCVLLLTCRSNWSQKCSIGESSGERAGKGSTSTLFWCKKSILALAMCGRALFCWNVAPFAAIKGSTWGVRISFSVSFGVKTAVDCHKMCASICCNSAPHRYISPAKTVVTKNTIVSTMFTTSTIDSSPPIYST